MGRVDPGEVLQVRYTGTPVTAVPRSRSSEAGWTDRSRRDEVISGLATGVEVPVEACDVVGFLECGIFGGVRRTGDPGADRDMAGVDPAVGQHAVEGQCPLA